MLLQIFSIRFFKLVSNFLKVNLNMTKPFKALDLERFCADSQQMFDFADLSSIKGEIFYSNIACSIFNINSDIIITV